MHELIMNIFLDCSTAVYQQVERTFKKYLAIFQRHGYGKIFEPTSKLADAYLRAEYEFDVNPYKHVMSMRVMLPSVSSVTHYSLTKIWGARSANEPYVNISSMRMERIRNGSRLDQNEIPYSFWTLSDRMNPERSWRRPTDNRPTDEAFDPDWSFSPDLHTISEDDAYYEYEYSSDEDNSIRPQPSQGKLSKKINKQIDHNVIPKNPEVTQEKDVCLDSNSDIVSGSSQILKADRKEKKMLRKEKKKAKKEQTKNSATIKHDLAKISPGVGVKKKANSDASDMKKPIKTASNESDYDLNKSFYYDSDDSLIFGKKEYSPYLYLDTGDSELNSGTSQESIDQWKAGKKEGKRLRKEKKKAEKKQKKNDDHANTTGAERIKVLEEQKKKINRDYLYYDSDSLSSWEKFLEEEKAKKMNRDNYSSDNSLWRSKEENKVQKEVDENSLPSLGSPTKLNDEELCAIEQSKHLSKGLLKPVPRVGYPTPATKQTELILGFDKTPGSMSSTQYTNASTKSITRPLFGSGKKFKSTAAAGAKSGNNDSMKAKPNATGCRYNGCVLCKSNPKKPCPTSFSDKKTNKTSTKPQGVSMTSVSLDSLLDEHKLEQDKTAATHSSIQLHKSSKKKQNKIDFPKSVQMESDSPTKQPLGSNQMCNMNMQPNTQLPKMDDWKKNLLQNLDFEVKQMQNIRTCLYSTPFIDDEKKKNASPRKRPYLESDDLLDAKNVVKSPYKKRRISKKVKTCACCQ